MKKKYAVLFAAVFAAAVFSGCSDSVPAAETGGAAMQTEQNEDTDVQPAEKPQEGTVVFDAVPVSETAAAASDIPDMTVSANNIELSLLDSVWYSDESSGAVISGEYGGDYFLLILGSKDQFTEGMTASQSDFSDPDSLQIAASVFRPSTGEAYAGATPQSLTDAQLTVNGFSGNDMDISISGTINTDSGSMGFEVSGRAELSDLAGCQNIVAELNALMPSDSGQVSGAKSFICPGCHGSKECRYCDGDGTCSACLGLMDHCISCGGSDVCRYCGGTGICHHCEGKGYMS